MDKPDKVVATVVPESKTNNNDRFTKGGPGGPGRPLGSKPKSFIDMERIRQAIVGSFDKVSGVDKLVALGSNPDTFPEYMRIVSWFMPKGAQVQINFPAFIAVDPELHAQAATKFIESLDGKDGDKMSPSVVLAALKKHTGERAESSNGRGDGKAN